MRLEWFTRMVVFGGLAACGLAVLVARSAPRPTEFRSRSEAHEAVINGGLLEVLDSAPRVLDTETGRVSPFALPEGETLESASFSGWIDDQGERQAAGFWIRRAGVPGNRLVTAVGLARFSYPSGRILDRVTEIPVPARAPCWYPGLVPRVLFATHEGKLFQYAFGGTRTAGAAAPGRLSSVVWRDPPAALSTPWVEHLTWPDDTRLGGRILASVSCGNPGITRRVYHPRRLWWLRLSGDGLHVDEAVRADDGAWDTDPWREESLPVLGRSSDGGLIVAFRRLSFAGDQMELYVAPVDCDTPTGPPTVRLAHARKMGDDVLGVPAMFSPDGKWLYALRKGSETRTILERYALEPSASTIVAKADEIPAR